MAMEVDGLQPSLLMVMGLGPPLPPAKYTDLQKIEFFSKFSICFLEEKLRKLVMDFRPCACQNCPDSGVSFVSVGVVYDKKSNTDF